MLKVQYKHILADVALCLALACTYGITAFMRPRMREIHKEEWWLYRNPRTESYVSSWMLWWIVCSCGLIFPAVNYLQRRSVQHFLMPCFLGYMLAVLVNGVLTNLVKLLVGRPRPDFFYRCYPTGEEAEHCTGTDDAVVIEGRKSFPSGHSSLAMASATYLSLFICAQLHLFSGGYQTSWRHSRRSLLLMSDLQSSSITTLPLPAAWRLCLALIPMCGAVIVALTRLIDFHHHCEDVAVGSLLGCVVGYMCYRVYFPSVKGGPGCHLAWAEAHQQCTTASMEGAPLTSVVAHRSGYNGSLVTSATTVTSESSGTTNGQDY